MPVFNIWIEPTTNEKDLTDFLTTSLNDFCDKHKLDKMWNLVHEAFTKEDSPNA